jgi:hypothetical protein
VPTPQHLRHRWRIVAIGAHHFRAGQPVGRVLSAGKQREIDAAPQRQPGAGAAHDPGATDEEYVHAPPF